ncbi:hypothetical protein BDF20DRAFT_855465 [Mycotypha africana]|uniref:uncharacterized protein n=1 Tax=Mycotypha africana TaxID=64632 RepID=UPI0022FFC55E|nr:uncharacterized protein BDF20DRAFT_855465 [Mycotypha africana]KAI8988396.1 hypothetical protein BDF20DRAFT_855465 [Mycotypha africana]
MAIFKGQCEDGYPSFICRDLGTITCIAVGDVRNSGKNSIVVVNAEGHAHIFDVKTKASSSSFNQQQQQQHISIHDYLKGGRRSSDSTMRNFRRAMNGGSSNTSLLNEEDNLRNQQQHAQQALSKSIHDLEKPNLTLKVPVNVNKILIADIDNDGLNEIILARTDRILHAFQLVPSDFTAIHPIASTTSLNINDKSFSNHSNVNATTVLSPNHTSSSINLTSGLTHHPSHYQHNYSARPTLASTTTNTSLVTTTAADEHHSNNSKKYRLLDKNMWVFDGQISSLCTTTHPEKPDEPLLLVAQPGNTFVIIDQDGKRLNKDFTPQQHNVTDDLQYNLNGTATSSINFGQNQPSNISNISAEDQDRIRSILLQHQAFASPSVDIPIDTTVDHSAITATKKRSGTAGGGRSWPPLSLSTSDQTGGTTDVEEEEEGEEIESGAIATEIVIGKRHLMGDSFLTNKVGMLSMDGTFSVYDLRTKATSYKDLFVTHKLFSLATLNVNYNNNRLNNATDISLMEKPAGYYLHPPHHRHGGTQTPIHNSNNAGSSSPRQQQLQKAAAGSSPISTTTASSRKASLPQQQQQHEELSRVPSKCSIDLNANKNSSSDFIRDSINALKSGKTDEAVEETTIDSDYESVSWSEGGSESDNETGCDLFVACAWNGVTYLIDWSERLDDEDESDSVIIDRSSDRDSASTHSSNESLDVDTTRIKYQLVKFAFEGRVCAFTAGHYCIANHVNVPCLFYVDFEDQIYVYYDVRISPGPVTGFIDTIDDDIEESLDRIMGLESAIDTLAEACQQELHEQDETNNQQIDLGDGWQGIAAVEQHGADIRKQQEYSSETAADLIDQQELQDMDFLSKSRCQYKKKRKACCHGIQLTALFYIDLPCG